MSDVNFFNSSIVIDKYGSNKIFNVSSINFHHPSEHTINGKRFDLELEIIHYPNVAKTDGVKGAIAHVLFDVERGVNKTEEEPDLIDNFF